MERNIPKDVWRSHLMKLVNEAPKPCCVFSKDCDDGGSSSPVSDSLDIISSHGDVISLAESISNLSTLPRSRGVEVHPPPPTLSAAAPISGLITSVNGVASTSSSSASSSVSSSKSSTSTIASGSKLVWADDSSLLVVNPFGKAFHGYLSHSQLTHLLSKDGQYLVRKADNCQDEEYILSLRFNNNIKNYLVTCDDSSGLLYLGDRDKPYETMEQIVTEGLTTMYLELKAGEYINLMCDITQYGKNAGNNNNRSHTGGCSPTNNGHFSSLSRKHSSSPSPSGSTLSRNSMERQRYQDLRSHSFHIHTFQELSRCHICHNFLWGLSSQGLQCRDCGFQVHEACREKTYFECEPKLSKLEKIFSGPELTTLVKASGHGKPPFVLEKCITQIEARGLYTEGIYRISGSRETTERLKAKLESERDKADLSEHMDIHPMCSLVKQFLRNLPTPLITKDVYELFLAANVPLTLDLIKKTIRLLPSAHQVTLKYLLHHLWTVAQNSDKNKMTPYNLSSVFAPSVLCPSITSLETLKVGTEALESMISNFPQLFPHERL